MQRDLASFARFRADSHQAALLDQEPMRHHDILHHSRRVSCLPTASITQQASEKASEHRTRPAMEFEANVSDAHQALECSHRVVQVIGDLHHSRESIAQMAMLGVFGPRVLDDVLELLLLLCGERERERVSERAPRN